MPTLRLCMVGRHLTVVCSNEGLVWNRSRAVVNETFEEFRDGDCGNPGCEAHHGWLHSRHGRGIAFRRERSPFFGAPQLDSCPLEVNAAPTDQTGCARMKDGDATVNPVYRPSSIAREKNAHVDNWSQEVGRETVKARVGLRYRPCSRRRRPHPSGDGLRSRS